MTKRRLLLLCLSWSFVMACGQDDDPTLHVPEQLEQERLSEEAEIQRQEQIEAQEERFVESEAQQSEMDAQLYEDWEHSEP